VKTFWPRQHAAASLAPFQGAKFSSHWVSSKCWFREARLETSLPAGSYLEAVL
jgi:hypothetical protein